jgi:hypothetical protein
MHGSHMNCPQSSSSERRYHALAFVFSFVLFVVLLLPGMSLAGAPVLTAQAFIHNDAGAIIWPWSISQSGDHGYYVTGAMSQDGWAVKTDAKGDILWRYDLRESKAGLINPGGVFIYGAVPANHRDTYLCASSVSQVATLVRLDRRGRELSKTPLLPDPQGRGDGRYVSLGASCMRWKSNLVYVGDEQFYERYGPHQSENDRFYWVLVFDKAGHIKRELQIPVDVRTPGRITAYIDGDSLLFSHTDNTNTELVQVDLSAGTSLKREVPGSAFVIRPIQSSFAFSFLRRPEVRLLRFGDDILSFSNQLREDTRVADAPRDFSGVAGYTQRDGSCMLFGYHLNVRRRPGVMGMVLLASSQAEDVVDLPTPDSATAIGIPQLMDVSTGYGTHAFAVLRKIPALDGAVIDFVDIK